MKQFGKRHKIDEMVCVFNLRSLFIIPDLIEVLAVSEMNKL